MLKSIATILLFGLLVFSCGKDDDFSYPRKFSYKGSEILRERVYLIGDNERFTEINPYKGYLDSLKNEFVVNYYHFIKDTLEGPFIESFELLSKDSIKIEFSISGTSEFITIPANADNINGEIIDPTILDVSLNWNKEKQEMRACFAIELGIILDPNNAHFELNQTYCTSNDINTELIKFLDQDDYHKNDTIGIYIMDLIYR